ncbi:MAG: hypothetical protein IKD31_03225 [Clostridia bacterium]|nr:hypothetical protein [Clostridia bacterium]
MRYRSYYYDVETGLYYLQSRYYNPEWGRFLNAEKYVYDVATRAVTNGGSGSLMKSTLFDINLKIDIGKCFYRATFRFLYANI